MNKSHKGDSQLIVARSNPAKDLELIEKALNQMPLLIGMKIAKPWLNHIAFGRNRIGCTLFGDICANRLRSVCFITQNIAAADRYF